MFFAAAIRLSRRIGHQCAERDLERPRAGAHADVVGSRAMDVDRIPADADGIVEMPCSRPRLRARGDILLDDRSHRDDASRFADVRMLRQSVDRAHDRRPQRELGRTVATAARRRLGLQPVQEPEAHALARRKGSGDFRRRPVEQARVAVVVAGPVDHRQVVRVARPELRAVDQPSIGPQRALRAGHRVEQVVREAAALLAVDLAAMHVDRQAVRLRGTERRVALRLRQRRAARRRAFARGRSCT